ncbi:MAG: serine/threonine protein phosphatase [Lachnospiraceae bacterium]|nr:serine/threonine protein phosphatase [Candidatus Hippenecus merdae]
MRKIFIGDVHGCNGSLCSLLTEIRLNIDDDLLVFLGDYFDGGPDAFRVWQTLQKLKTVMGNRCVLLCGNHEFMMLDSASAGSWPVLFGWRTVASIENNQKTASELTTWVKENTCPWYEDDEIIAVHGGLSDQSKLQKQLVYDIVWDRDTFEKGTYNGGKPAICGHTPQKEPRWSHDGITETATDGPLPDHGLINIDTDCVAGNCLTALVLENGRMSFYHSAAEKR